MADTTVTNAGAAAPTKSLVGTETAKNLATAYMAESGAVTRYTFYSQQCKKDKYIQYSNIFAETADNELHHAKIFLRFLEEGGVTATALGVDSGILTDTVNNLKTAAAEEQKEGVDLYTAAAKTAREEGFPEIAARFAAIATIEAHHEARFKKMSERIATNTVWKSDTPIMWQCLECGYIFQGTEPPAKCPACQHPYQYFQRMEDNI